jgi:hypothetical protein
MNNAVSLDEEEQHPYTQPDAVDLTVDLDSPKCKGTTQVNKTSKKKKQLPKISNTNLAATFETCERC